MRKNLKEISGVRQTFTGEFVRLGHKNGYKGPLPTILLQNIKFLNGEPVCDHIWFNYTKGFEHLGDIPTGCTIQFDARSKEYLKGYKGRREDVYKPVEKDFKLSHPSKIRVLKIKN